MDLRDRFAAQFAASLASAFSDPQEIARRAYDLAEVMLAERARRIDDDERRAIEVEPHRDSLVAPPLPETDEEIDLRFLGEPYDASEDRPPWGAERPGLARTQPPDAAEPGEERSA